VKQPATTSPARTRVSGDTAPPSGVCGHDRRVPAPVDCVYASAGIRLRHVAGHACLDCRSVVADAPTHASDPLGMVERAVRGETEAVVLKTAPAAGVTVRCTCGGDAEPARLDLALSDDACVVLEAVTGHWCWGCRTATIPEQGLELRRRARAFAPGEPPALAPSLLYDTPSHPSSIQTEITTRCNLSCSYCTNRLLDDTRDVSWEQFLAVLDRIDLSRVDNFDFTGLGEPTLHARLPDMIRAVRARGAPTQIRIVTNGTVDSRTRLQPLCAAGATSIGFSIDTLDPEAFARARGGASLAVVLRNLESLVAYRGPRSSPQLRIKAVLIGDMYQEAERLLAYSARLGLSMPQFSRLDGRESAQPQYDQEWLSHTLTDVEGVRLLDWAGERWRALGGRPEDEAPARPTPAERAAGFHHASLIPAGLCRWAVDAAFVDSAGATLSCCEQMIDLPRLSWQSLSGAALGEQWGDTLLWQLRLPLALGRVPTGCGGCPWAPGGGAQVVSIRRATS
jgi:pyruvate-formate lyase-activating enzyme